MKKISPFATLLVLFASLGVPLFAFAACVPPHVNGNDGYCYAVGADSIWTRVPGETPDTQDAFGKAAMSTSGGRVDISKLTPYSKGIIDVINTMLVPVFTAIAFIVFLYGVYKYFILGAADEKSRIDGRQFVLWGIIGFVIILSVWGLVGLVSGTLGLSPGGTAPPSPTL